MTIKKNLPSLVKKTKNNFPSLVAKKVKKNLPGLDRKTIKFINLRNLV